MCTALIFGTRAPVPRYTGDSSALEMLLKMRSSPCALGLLLFVGTVFGVNDTATSTPAPTNSSTTGRLLVSTTHTSTVTEFSGSIATKTPVGTTCPVDHDHKTKVPPGGNDNLGTRAAKSTTTSKTTMSKTTTSETTTSQTTTSQTITSHNTGIGLTTEYHSSSSTPGYIISFFIIVAIIILAIVIYRIRKKTRQYSFDLYQKSAEDSDIPLSSVGQKGVFASDQNDEKSGGGLICASDIPEELKTPPGETGLQNGGEKPESDNDDPSKLPSDDSSSCSIIMTPCDKPLDFNFELIDSDPNQSSKTSSESLGEPQNENNNNTMGCYGDACSENPTPAAPSETFTEINLDETV